MSLIRVESADDVLAKRKADFEKEQASPLIQGLASEVQKRWEKAYRHKESCGIKDTLKACHRQRKGEYDPQKLAMIREAGGAEVFMNLTNVKCRAIESWIKDIMHPAQDRAWDIRPTPIADMPPQYTRSIHEQVAKEVQVIQQKYGQQVPPDVILERVRSLYEYGMGLVQEEAKARARNMEKKIDDQLHDGGWSKALNDFIYDITTYPSAILKAPVIRRRKVLAWKQEGNDWVPEPKEKYVTEVKRISPFNIFPGEGVSRPEDGDMFETDRMSRADLMSLVGVPGYSDNAIRQVIADDAKTSNNRLWFKTESEELEENSFLDRDSLDLFDVLIMWGSIPGSLLVEWGVDANEVEDLEAAYPAEVWMIGDKVIKAMVNPDPLGRKPYFVTSYERIPGNFWGSCPPLIIQDVQQMVNASARALANNMAVASGPQVEVDVDRLPAGEEITNIIPFKVWQSKSALTSAAGGSPAVRFFQPDMNAQPLLAVYQYFSKMADDYLAIASFAYGSSANLGGAGRTSSGLQLLQSNTARGIKQVVSNIDIDVVEPIITRLYEHNLQYEDNNAIKGDLKVRARGSRALIAREQLDSQRLQLLQMSANPMDAQIFGMNGRAELWKDILRGYDIPPDSIIPDPDRLAQIEQAMMEAQNAQADPTQSRAGGGAGQNGAQGQGGNGGAGPQPGAVPQ